MVKISEPIAERTRRTMEYTKKHEAELPQRTISVLAKKADDWLSSASRPGSDLVWYSDLSKERGGQEKGPSPLTQLLSSMAFCQFTHYVENAVVENATLNSLEMKIDGKVSEQRPRRFTEVNYEVRVTSAESDDKIRKIAKAAAEDCYVTNTLRAACKVSGIIIHNDRKIDEH